MDSYKILKILMPEYHIAKKGVPKEWQMLPTTNVYTTR